MSWPFFGLVCRGHSWPREMIRGRIFSETVRIQAQKSAQSREEKAYTTTTERKSFGELFWPQRKTFQAGGGYKNPRKNQENHIYHRNLSSVAPIFWGKEKFCTGAGRCMLSFSQQSCRPKVGVTDQKSELQPGRPPESEPNHPEKGPEWGLGASTETTL